MNSRELKIENFIERTQKFAQMVSLLSSDSELLAKIGENNSLFTPKMVKCALDGIYSKGGVKSLLCRESLIQYIEKIERVYGAEYDQIIERNKDKRILVVASGNIPAAGFADFFISLMCGFKVTVKLSHSDQFLLKEIVKRAKECYPNGTLRFSTILIDSTLEQYESLLREDVDGIVFSGSSLNKAKIEALASKMKIPLLARGTTFSLAIVDSFAGLNDNQKEKIMKSLAFDIFCYYGQGCRSVSYLFLPQDFDMKMFRTIANLEWGDELNLNQGWKNNYFQQRTIARLTNKDYEDMDSFLLVRNDTPFPPTSVIYYDTYSCEKVKDFIEKYSNPSNQIQQIYNIGKSYRCGSSQMFTLLENINNTEGLEFFYRSFFNIK